MKCTAIPQGMILKFQEYKQTHFKEIRILVWQIHKCYALIYEIRNAISYHLNESVSYMIRQVYGSKTETKDTFCVL